VDPAFWSLALLRWDINIRKSAVLGLVGAGGIGVALDAALNNLYWDQVGLILAVIFAVAIVTELVTSWLRARLSACREMSERLAGAWTSGSTMNSPSWGKILSFAFRSSAARSDRRSMPALRWLRVRPAAGMDGRT
jgi:hypothetical protein